MGVSARSSDDLACGDIPYPALRATLPTTRFARGRRDKKALRCRLCLTLSRTVICPTGTVRKILSSPRAKNIVLLFFGNMWFTFAHPVPATRGASRSSETLGWDAVDAAASGATIAQGR